MITKFNEYLNESTLIDFWPNAVKAIDDNNISLLYSAIPEFPDDYKCYTICKYAFEKNRLEMVKYIAKIWRLENIMMHIIWNNSIIGTNGKLLLYLLDEYNLKNTDFNLISCAMGLNIKHKYRMFEHHASKIMMYFLLNNDVKIFDSDLKIIDESQETRVNFYKWIDKYINDDIYTLSNIFSNCTLETVKEFCPKKFTDKWDYFFEMKQYKK